MSISSAQREGFDRRLSRIRKGAPNTMGEIEIGPRDESAPNGKRAKNTVRVKRKRNKKVQVGQGATTPMMLFGAFIGGLSMFVGLATDYHFFQEGGLINMPTPLPELEPYMQYAPFAFGGLLALAFAWTFRLTSVLRFAALLGGFFAVFHYQPQMVNAMPDLYNNLFSKQYVAEMREQTKV